MRALKLLAIFVLPVFLFDGCLNRDPSLYLDANSKLIAPWVNAPLSLNFRNRGLPDTPHFQIPDVTEFLMSGSIFTGKTADDYFVVRSSDGFKQIFPTAAERDRALKNLFSLNLSDMHPMPWYSGVKGNLLYPYNCIYYAFVTALIVMFTLRSQPRGNSPN